MDQVAELTAQKIQEQVNEEVAQEVSNRTEMKLKGIEEQLEMMRDRMWSRDW